MSSTSSAMMSTPQSEPGDWTSSSTYLLHPSAIDSWNGSIYPSHSFNIAMADASSAHRVFRPIVDLPGSSCVSKSSRILPTTSLTSSLSNGLTGTVHSAFSKDPMPLPELYLELSGRLPQRRTKKDDNNPADRFMQSVWVERYLELRPGYQRKPRVPAGTASPGRFPVVKLVAPDDDEAPVLTDEILSGVKEYFQHQRSGELMYKLQSMKKDLDKQQDIFTSLLVPLTRMKTDKEDAKQHRNGQTSGARTPDTDSDKEADGEAKRVVPGEATKARSHTDVVVGKQPAPTDRPTMARRIKAGHESRQQATTEKFAKGNPIDLGDKHGGVPQFGQDASREDMFKNEPGDTCRIDQITAAEPTLTVDGDSISSKALEDVPVVHESGTRFGQDGAANIGHDTASEDSLPLPSTDDQNRLPGADSEGTPQLARDTTHGNASAAGLGDHPRVSSPQPISSLLGMSLDHLFEQVNNVQDSSVLNHENLREGNKSIAIESTAQRAPKTLPEDDDHATIDTVPAVVVDDPPQIALAPAGAPLSRVFGMPLKVLMREMTRTASLSSKDDDSPYSDVSEDEALPPEARPLSTIPEEKDEDNVESPIPTDQEAQGAEANDSTTPEHGMDLVEAPLVDPKAQTEESSPLALDIAKAEQEDEATANKHEEEAPEMTICHPARPLDTIVHTPQVALSAAEPEAETQSKTEGESVAAPSEPAEEYAADDAQPTPRIEPEPELQIHTNNAVAARFVEEGGAGLSPAEPVHDQHAIAAASQQRKGARSGGNKTPDEVQRAEATSSVEGLSSQETACNNSDFSEATDADRVKGEHAWPSELNVHVPNPGEREDPAMEADVEDFDIEDLDVDETRSLGLSNNHSDAGGSPGVAITVNGSHPPREPDNNQGPGGHDLRHVQEWLELVMKAEAHPIARNATKMSVLWAQWHVWKCVNDLASYMGYGMGVGDMPRPVQRAIWLTPRLARMAVEARDPAVVRVVLYTLVELNVSMARLAMKYGVLASYAPIQVPMLTYDDICHIAWQDEAWLHERKGFDMVSDIWKLAVQNMIQGYGGWPWRDGGAWIQEMGVDIELGHEERDRDGSA